MNNILTFKHLETKFPNWKLSFHSTYRFLSVILIIGLLAFYVFQINTEISKRYLINDYKKRIVELSSQNKVLEISFAQNGSLDRIVELVASLNFEKTDKIHYIRILDTQVVVTK